MCSLFQNPEMSGVYSGTDQSLPEHRKQCFCHRINLWMAHRKVNLIAKATRQKKLDFKIDYVCSLQNC